MESFTLAHPSTRDAASQAAQVAGSAYIAGGTDLLQLMKNNVVAPQHLVDLRQHLGDEITVTPRGLRLGALATMADVAMNKQVARDWPAISQALLLSASAQIRNMGTIGGNLLQRTRCNYFRDTGFACNKREPGSGCPAIVGDNRNHAILGVSDHCIATHPSDLPVALMALDASVEIAGNTGAIRKIGLGDLYRLPGDTPHIETTLAPGEIITAIEVPASTAARNSIYLKLRDRSSFAFALISVAVAMDIDGGTVRHARVAMGGMGTMPWRMVEVENALNGAAHDDTLFARAAAHAADGAKPATQNPFKMELARRAVLRALQTTNA